MFDPRFEDHGDDHSRHAAILAEKDMRRWQNDGSCSNWCGDQEVIQFRANQDQENMGSDDSGFCSPPLWENSPNSPKSPSQPLLSHHVYTSLSPKSRLQRITRGQRELMDMVRNLPESSYELSLKDLVEHRQMEAPIASPLGGGLNSSNKQILQQGVGDKQILQQGVGVKVRRQGSKSTGRGGSFEIENKGLFLKMGFPFSLQSKKRNSFSGTGSGKVSPRPEGTKGSGSGGERERDWWKKKFTGSSDSDSSRTSNNSGSSGSTGTTGTNSSRKSNDHSHASSRIKNGFLSSCFPFFNCRNKFVD